MAIRKGSNRPLRREQTANIVPHAQKQTILCQSTGLPHTANTLIQNRARYEITDKTVILRIANIACADCICKAPCMDSQIGSPSKAGTSQVFLCSDLQGSRTLRDRCGRWRQRVNIKNLKTVPNARETLFNRAHMIAAAQTCIEKDSQPKRVEFIVGDPFMPLSQRGDVYIFSRILAKLSAKKGLKTVQNCRIILWITHQRAC